MLRRALQPVRDVDVYLAKLDILRSTLLAPRIVDRKVVSMSRLGGLHHRYDLAA